MASAKQRTATKKSTGKGKASTVFPSGRIGSLLRKGRFSKRVSKSAGFYAASVISYLARELLEVVAKGSKKNARISPRALTLAVRADRGGEGCARPGRDRLDVDGLVAEREVAELVEGEGAAPVAAPRRPHVVRRPEERTDPRHRRERRLARDADARAPDLEGLPIAPPAPRRADRPVRLEARQERPRLLARRLELLPQHADGRLRRVVEGGPRRHHRGTFGAL